MTTPSIKEALVLSDEHYEAVETLRTYSWLYTNRLDDEARRRTLDRIDAALAVVRSALATLSPPAGERREAIARAVRSVLMDGLESNDPGNWLVPVDAEDIGDLCEHVADAILATGLVQDEAAIRADEREKCAKLCDERAVKLRAKATGMKQSHAHQYYDRDTEARVIAAAIRSARDGGDET